MNKDKKELTRDLVDLLDQDQAMRDGGINNPALRLFNDIKKQEIASKIGKPYRHKDTGELLGYVLEVPTKEEWYND